MASLRSADNYDDNDAVEAINDIDLVGKNPNGCNEDNDEDAVVEVDDEDNNATTPAAAVAVDGQRHLTLGEALNWENLKLLVISCTRPESKISKTSANAPRGEFSRSTGRGSRGKREPKSHTIRTWKERDSSWCSSIVRIHSDERTSIIISHRHHYFGRVRRRYALRDFLYSALMFLLVRAN